MYVVNRNEVRVGKAWQRASAIVQKARLLLDEFHTTNFKLTQIKPNDEVHWVPLDAPYYKLNVGEATFANLQAIGVAVSIRDSASKVNDKTIVLLISQLNILKVLMVM